jgi:hypothetical protein
MTSSIMHSCDESDDSLRITSVEVEVCLCLFIIVGHLQYIDHHLYVLCTYFRTCAYVGIDFALF